MTAQSERDNRQNWARMDPARRQGAGGHLEQSSCRWCRTALCRHSPNRPVLHAAFTFLTFIHSAAFLTEHQFSSETIDGYHGAFMSACFSSVGFSFPHYFCIYTKMISFVSVNPDGAHGQAGESRLGLGGRVEVLRHGIPVSNTTRRSFGFQYVLVFHP
jgi:hypothetical protein